MMKIILKVVVQSFSTFIYIGFLLFLFIIMFGILGMQLFQKMDKSNENYYYFNFDTFLNATLTIFNVISLDGWGDVLVLLNTSGVNKFITTSFVIFVIFFGNYVLLNLVLAILLDGFTDDILQNNEFSEENGKESVLEREEILENEIEESKNYYLSLLNQKELEEKKNKMKKKIQNKILRKKKIRINYAYFFSQKFYVKMASHKYLENFILLTILLSSLKLAIDTYFLSMKASEKSLYNKFSFYIDSVFTFIYFLEMIIKMQGFGIFFGKNTYFKDSWNCLDFFYCYNFFS